MPASPLFKYSSATSMTVTLRPAWAHTCVMPALIRPHPSTATLLSAIYVVITQPGSGLQFCDSARPRHSGKAELKSQNRTPDPVQRLKRLRNHGARITISDGTHTHTISFKSVAAPAELKKASPMGDDTI